MTVSNRYCFIEKHFQLCHIIGANQLYLMRPLTMDNVVLQSQSRDGDKFLVKLRKVRKILETEGIFLQFLNTIVTNGMRHLGLQLVNRNLYDAAAAVSETKTEKTSSM